MSPLCSMLERLKNGQIVEQLHVPERPDAIECLLDQRDTDEFSSKWMQAFRDVELKKSAAPLTPREAELVTKMRENAYLLAFKRWKSPDLASYISDDFGLIGDAAATRVENPWIDYLLECYLKGTVPSDSVPGGIDDRFER
jgi:hypothetical protein